jgi:hypothetical protein
MEGETRVQALPIPQIVGVLVFGIALWAQVGDAYVGQHLEDGLLLVLGKSWTRGDGLSFLHLPGSPTATAIPPLYPMLLSVVGHIWPAFPDNLVLIQIVDSGVLAIAAWIITTHLIALHGPPVVTAAVVLVGFLSSSVLGLTVSAFSEPLFLALAAGSILLADRNEATLHSAVEAGLLAGLAALTHGLGPAVVIGVTLGYAVRRQWPLAGAALFVGVVVFAPWFVWSITTTRSNVLADAAMTATRAASAGDRGVLGLGTMIGQLLPQLPGWLWYPLGLLALTLAAVGMVARWRDASALPITFGLALLWASVVDRATVRWIWVLFPWFLVLAFWGARRLWTYTGSVRVAVAIAAGILAVSYVPKPIADVLQRRIAHDVTSANEDLTRLVYTIVQELPDSAVIASDVDAMIYLYTSRQAVPAPPPNIEGVNDSPLSYYCRYGVTHIARVENARWHGALGVPDSVVQPVFELTGGPALFKLQCPQ